MALATEKKWLFTLFSVAFLSLLLYISAISDFTTLRSTPSTGFSTSSSSTAAESGVQYGLSTPPAFARFPLYLIENPDMSHAFSSMNRDFNFIDHTSDLGWKEHQRVQPVVVDPGIYLARKTQIFHASEKRPTPEAFKFFAGSPWVTLSRSFVEFCVLGWDNLPRTLLMYFTNVILSQEGYFHTVICNSPEFQNTTINSDLRYMVWDNPPRMEPHFLNLTNYEQMVHSGAAFARQFEKDDHVLNLIDRKILGRQSPYRATPGAWCAGKKSWWVDPCSNWGDVNVIKPGPGVERFEKSIVRIVNDENSESSQCK